MLKNKWFQFSLILFLLPLACILLTYHTLPSYVPTHFNMHGEVDGYMPKLFGLYGGWTLFLLIHLFVSFITFKDPKKDNIPQVLLRILLLLCPIFCLLVEVIIISYALGYRFDHIIVINIIIGLLFILIGNYLPKVRKNYALGIRTPWTLESQENWTQTHRLSGYLFVLAGMLYIITSVLGYMFIGLIVILIACFISIFYSYFLHKKGI